MSSKKVYEQYRSLKKEQPEAVLLFQLGIFFTMLEKDAYIANKLFGLKLSLKDLGGGRVLSCGIPVTSLEKYEKLFLEKGCSLAICVQENKGGVMVRKISRVLSPSSQTETIAETGQEEYLLFLKAFLEKENRCISILSELEDLDLDNTSPMSALEILQKWKEKKAG